MPQSPAEGEDLRGPGRSLQAEKTQAKAKWDGDMPQTAVGRGQSSSSPQGPTEPGNAQS